MSQKSLPKKPYNHRWLPHGQSYWECIMVFFVFFCCPKSTCDCTRATEWSRVRVREIRKQHISIVNFTIIIIIIVIKSSSSSSKFCLDIVSVSKTTTGRKKWRNINRKITKKQDVFLPEGCWKSEQEELRGKWGTHMINKNQAESKYYHTVKHCASSCFLRLFCFVMFTLFHPDTDIITIFFSSNCYNDLFHFGIK